MIASGGTMLQHQIETSLAYQADRQPLQVRRVVRHAAVSVIAGLFLLPALLPADSAAAATSVSPTHETAAVTGTPRPFLNLPYDGTDPGADGCANSTTTPASISVTNGGINYGTLQLKWSNTCKTNWGRFIPSSTPIYEAAVWVIREADNMTCGDPPGNGCSTYGWFSPPTIYSNQLYGCNYVTYAQVEVFPTEESHFWINTSAKGGC
jgi:hypothetical protein